MLTRRGGSLRSTAAITGGQCTDGSAAYRELRETDKPYDPLFNAGTVTWVR